MVYCGSAAVSLSGHGTEPALLDGRLSAPPATLRQSDELGYWPSYDRLSPAARGAYLDWLADGRRALDVPIGFVFLFFYGLERRALGELTADPAVRAELPLLRAEAKRLLDLFGGHASFAGYATEFNDFLRIAEGRSVDQLRPPSERRGYELPASVRYALAELSAAGRPVPWEWAWAWYRNHPETILRTPATRCPREHRFLFRRRYQERYGDGMVVKPNKTSLRLGYHPASASFGGEVELLLPDLPDVARQSGPARRLQELGLACESELDPYSRYVGRNADQSYSLPALANLPRELVQAHRGAQIAQLREDLARILGDRGQRVFAARHLMAVWPGEQGDKLPRREHLALAQLLGKLGYGLEPDPRFGGSALVADEPVVLFDPGSEAPETASPAYAAEALVLHLFVAVATADEQLGEDERRHLVDHVARNRQLTAAERTRLGAHMRWLLAARPGLSGLKRRAEALDAGQRELLGQFLVSVAGIDGVITADEVVALERAYRAIGLDPESVHRHLHELATGSADEPIEVQPGEPGAPGHRLPPESRGGLLRLDAALVEQKLRDTARVTAFLTDHLTEEDEPPAPVSAAEDAWLVDGLDARHSALLRRLPVVAALARSEFERHAQAVGVMPDGALECLNEAAFEHYDEPLCEGEDPLELNLAVLRELLA